MSKFFAVLSKIDPDQFIVQVQTPVAKFETPPLQVKWSKNEVLFLLSLYKKRENSIFSWWMKTIIGQRRNSAQRVKRYRAKKALQSKESLTDLFKEYQREQREEEEEKEKHLIEMHQQKMQRFDRWLELYEKDISKWAMLSYSGLLSIIFPDIYIVQNENFSRTI